MMAWTAPQKVIVGVSTLAPGLRPKARNEISRAAVHDDTATACSASTHDASSFSNSRTSGPLVTQPEASTRQAASMASAVIVVRAKGTRSKLVHGGAAIIAPPG